MLDARKEDLGTLTTLGLAQFPNQLLAARSPKDPDFQQSDIDIFVQPIPACQIDPFQSRRFRVSVINRFTVGLSSLFGVTYLLTVRGSHRVLRTNQNIDLFDG